MSPVAGIGDVKSSVRLGGWVWPCGVVGAHLGSHSSWPLHMPPLCTACKSPSSLQTQLPCLGSREGSGMPAPAHTPFSGLVRPRRGFMGMIHSEQP